MATKAQLRGMTFKLIKKDPGDTDLVDTINTFINMAYKEVAQIDMVSKTAEIVASNGEATLPADIFRINFIEDEDKNPIYYNEIGNTVRCTDECGNVASGTFTLHYFKYVSDLVLDTDIPEIHEYNHDIIPFGAAQLFKLMKDDTLKDDFGSIFERKKSQIKQPRIGNTKITALRG